MCKLCNINSEISRLRALTEVLVSVCEDITEILFKTILFRSMQHNFSSHIQGLKLFVIHVDRSTLKNIPLDAGFL